MEIRGKGNMRWEGFTISSIFLKFCVNNKVKKYITKEVGQEKSEHLGL